MRVLLFNTQTRRYYADRNQWVATPLRARDFFCVQRAVRLAARRKLGPVEVVLAFEDPVSEMALPLSFARRMEQAQFTVSSIDLACLPPDQTRQRRTPGYIQP